MKSILKLILVGVAAAMGTVPLKAGKTNVADSVAFSDVSAAIAASDEGDVVRIPAGSGTWASSITVTKGISVIGAGTNATTISGAGTILLSVALKADRPIRFTGINFVQPSSTKSPIIEFQGRNSAGLGVPITSFRVDHCKFTFGNRAVHARGWAYGVIDHCTFENCNIMIGISGDNNGAWSRPRDLGSTNCVCIEDNVFVRNDNSNADSEPIYIYHQTGARSTIRHNLFDGSNYTKGASLFVEAHGNQNYLTGNNSDFRSTVLVECYSNEMRALKSARFAYFRGGSQILYSNKVFFTSGTVPTIKVTEEEAWQTLFFPTLRSVPRGDDQISNSFFWANTVNGINLTNIVLQTTNDIAFIKQSRDYWMEAPNSFNGDPPGICAEYKQLVYPHPLASAPTSIGLTPPSNLRARN